MKGKQTSKNSITQDASLSKAGEADYYMNENIRIDLKESFEFFDKKKTGSISRDNIKSIMGNFGWFNCASSDLEKAIDQMFPSELGSNKKKQNFTISEV